jgi:nucleotide-binding universal stress UspA family protein
MLIAVDLSETATTAARWASEHFAPEAELVLLHVIDPPRRPRFADRDLPSDDAIEAMARQYAEGRMQALSTELGARVSRREIRIGKPYEQIAALATEIAADLVVIGPHGDRPRPSPFLGTTAERTARTSPVPVLVVTDPPAGAPSRILTPVEDVSITPRLLAWTKDLAEQFDAAVTLLHVWSAAAYSHVASMSFATTTTEAEARDEIQNELRESANYWLAELARTGINRDRVDCSVRYGHAGDIALETATFLAADLIVLGRRGSGLVAPMLLGSTVGTVMHGARCPVLIVTDTPE